MNGLSGISGLNGLGELPNCCKNLISQNTALIQGIYKKAEAINGFAGLGKLPAKQKGVDETNRVMSFDEVFKLYNQGISETEVKAWVWYKRSQGVPMIGWEKFYLKGDKSSNEQLVYTIKDTILKDNYFRDTKNMPKNTLLGKYLKTHKYDNSTNYYIVRHEEALCYVNAKDCKITTQKSTASEEELTKLIKASALFYSDGELLPYSVFAYSNMYDRELQLQKDKNLIIAKYGEAVYNNHEKVIKENKPLMLTITNPNPKERPIITAISDFANNPEIFGITTVRDEYLDLEDADQFKKVNGEVQRKKEKEKILIDFDGEKKYALTEVFCAWLFSLNADTEFNKSSAIDIVDYYIEMKPLRDDKLSKEAKAEIKANARAEGEEMFAKFLYEVVTFEDQQKIDFLWNKMYNGWSDINYLKIPIAFECSARFKTGILMLSEAQRQGVAFMEAVGSGINAFDVGVGKTITAIANLAANLYNGKCKRPLIVVPKPTYEKWITEIMGIEKKQGKEVIFIPGFFSGTKITLNDWFNLGTDIAKKHKLDKPVPEKSITIVTYEGFKKIGFGHSISNELLDELINILGQNNNKTARDKEIDYQKMRNMIGVGNKGTIADIDVLGFDYIIIDEAHRCKNVFAMVKADENKNKRYNMSGAVSETGQKAFFITNYLQRKFGRNVMLLTATPFTNSPLEIYSMLSLVAYEDFKKNNISNLDTFMDLFVLPYIEWAANYKEEVIEKEVIKSFNNRILLSRLIYNHILYKTGEEAGVKRPCKINLPLLNRKNKNDNKQVLTYLNMNYKQRENQNAIVGALRAATLGKTNSALLFKALGASLNNALSPYLVKDTPADYKEFVENSPKIKYTCEAIASVKKYHEDRNEPISGQIIYMNRGKEFFPFIKEYLEEELGYKKAVLFEKIKVDEVEIITSEISETAKENIKEAFLEGIVKVIIGTATIREGIDLQKNGTVIYNLLPDWNPTDLRQLEGRIWRQGNKFGYVRIVLPLVQDSMDVFIFQKLEEKTARINDIWFKGNRGNVLDLENLDPQEIKLALITDVNHLVKMFFDQEFQKLLRESRKLNANLEQVNQIISDISKYKEYRQNCIDDLQKKFTEIKNHNIFDKEAEKTYTKDQIKRAKEIFEYLTAFVEQAEKEDKNIISLHRQIDNFQYFSDLRWFIFSKFKEYLSKVKKTERNILKPKGYDMNSNLKEVKENLIKERAALVREASLFIKDEEIKKRIDKSTEEELQKYESLEDFEEYCGKGSIKWNDLMIEINRKKSAINVNGKSAEDRANEFATLNYLLSFKANEVNPEDCAIPYIDVNTTAATDKEKRIRIAKAKAIAKLKLLALIN